VGAQHHYGIAKRIDVQSS